MPKVDINSIISDLEFNKIVSNNELIDHIMLQYIDNITSQFIAKAKYDLKVLLIDFILKIKDNKFNQSEFISLSDAIKLFGIDIKTFNSWFSKNLINKYIVSGKIIISCSEVREIIHRCTTIIRSDRTKYIDKLAA